MTDWHTVPSGARWRSAGGLPALATALAGVVLGQIALPGAIGQQPTFTTEADVVAVDVSVSDDRQRSVNGLPRDAFQILEDDRPQTITQFTNDPVPISVVVALDTSSSMRGDRFDHARQAVGQFIDRLASADEVSIVGFDDTPYVIAPWTASRAETARALNAAAPVRAGGFTSLYGAVGMGLSALNHAAGRRRALLAISDGNDEMAGDRRYHGDAQPFATNLSAARRLREAVAAITRSEGLVYAVGVDGSIGVVRYQSTNTRSSR